MDKPLEITTKGALTRITLDRPRKLNALNDAMRVAIAAALARASRDPEIYALVIDQTSPRAFCAGGDVRELTALAASDQTLAAQSVAAEYTLNWALDCFTKPTASLIDGHVMGSGAGLMLYGTHRVAADGFSFAMPETAIGFFPDVGTASVLANLPNELGIYLGLTGAAIGAAAAYRLGIVTHCIGAEHFPDIIARLEQADPIDPLLDRLHRMPPSTAPGPDDPADRATLIEDLFAAPTITAIFAGLTKVAATTSPDAPWCAQILATLESRSPLSLAVTLRHLRECRGLPLREVLIRDYRLARRFLLGTEFTEGVRALLIDKDGHPRWRHSSVNEVRIEEIEEYFASLGAAELDLPEREKMQETYR